jgi:hypothetical protein
MYGIYNRRGRRPLCMVFITTDVRVPSSLMYGIYNNRQGRCPLCMVFITTDVPSSLMYGIYNNRRGRRPLCMVFITTDGAVVPYAWYL